MIYPVVVIGRIVQRDQRLAFRLGNAGGGCIGAIDDGSVLRLLGRDENQQRAERQNEK